MNDLEKLHKVELEILDYIVDVCEKNNIEYCLIYGSALGAYRHKGFIPWDDDIDVAMLRKDYVLFCEKLKRDNSRYVFQDMYNEKNYFMTFGKVRKKGTVFRESISEYDMKEMGIYVDVFPLDIVPDSTRINFTLKKSCINYLKHTVKFLSHKKLYKEKQSVLGYLFSTVISIPTKIYGIRNTLRKIDYLAKRDMDVEGQYLAEYDVTGDIQVIKKEVYFPTKKIEFENKLYRVPGNIEEYLRTAYGNTFMELPPENQRHTHTPVELYFGE